MPAERDSPFLPAVWDTPWLPDVHHVVAARLCFGKRALGVAQNAIAYTAQASVGGQTPLGQQFQSLG